MQSAINTPGRQPAASSVRGTVTLGVLLFAPVLLIFPLAIVGEAFGWVAGITFGWLLALALLWSSTSWTAPGEGTRHPGVARRSPPGTPAGDGRW